VTSRGRWQSCRPLIVVSLLFAACSALPSPTVTQHQSVEPPATEVASPQPTSPLVSPGGDVFSVSGVQAIQVALIVRFVTAFNAADLDTALGLMTDDPEMSDCDFERHEVVDMQGKARIRAWLGQRFADHDRMVIGGIFNVNPDSDRAVGVEFSNRVSDTIVRLGAVGGVIPGVVAKVVFDADGHRIATFANGPFGADPAVVARLCSVAVTP
jgi:hypothetical protein